MAGVRASVMKTRGGPPVTAATLKSGTASRSVWNFDRTLFKYSWFVKSSDAMFVLSDGVILQINSTWKCQTTRVFFHLLWICAFDFSKTNLAAAWAISPFVNSILLCTMENYGKFSASLTTTVESLFFCLCCLVQIVDTKIQEEFQFGQIYRNLRGEFEPFKKFFFIAFIAIKFYGVYSNLPQTFTVTTRKWPIAQICTCELEARHSRSWDLSALIL